MQMIPPHVCDQEKKQLSNYALELEHVTYVTMMRELFKSTSGLLGENVEKRHNFESKVFTSLRWFLLSCEHKRMSNSSVQTVHDEASVQTWIGDHR